MHSHVACDANVHQLVDDVRKNILRKEIGRTEAIKRRNKIREKLSAEFEDVTVSDSIQACHVRKHNTHIDPGSPASRKLSEGGRASQD